MTRLSFVSAALIAASVYQAYAVAAAPARRAALHTTGDCVRAPAEGAYATAPYKEPPCMPKTTN